MLISQYGINVTLYLRAAWLQYSYCTRIILCSLRNYRRYSTSAVYGRVGYYTETNKYGYKYTPGILITRSVRSSSSIVIRFLPSYTSLKIAILYDECSAALPVVLIYYALNHRRRQQTVRVHKFTYSTMVRVLLAARVSHSTRTVRVELYEYFSVL